MLRYLPTLIIVGFALYCLFDVSRSPGPEVRGLPRLAWVALIVLVPILGGVAWLIAGRPRPQRPPGAGPRATPSVLGPDDDPDFLRGLNNRAERGRDLDDGDGASDEDRR